MHVAYDDSQHGRLSDVWFAVCFGRPMPKIYASLNMS